LQRVGRSQRDHTEQQRESARKKRHSVPFSVSGSPAAISVTR